MSAVVQINTAVNPAYVAIPDATALGITMYSNAGVGAPIRPAANAVGAIAGVTAIMIWNVTDKAPQYSDGVNWYDANGNLS